MCINPVSLDQYPQTSNGVQLQHIFIVLDFCKLAKLSERDILIWATVINIIF